MKPTTHSPPQTLQSFLRRFMLHCCTFAPHQQICQVGGTLPFATPPEDAFFQNSPDGLQLFYTISMDSPARKTP